VPSGVKEPFQVQPPEFCSVANYTEAYGRPNVWGWSDTNCGNQYFPMCRINSEPPQLMSIWPAGRVTQTRPGAWCAEPGPGEAPLQHSSITP
jgi:hypothetical protein